MWPALPDHFIAHHFNIPVELWHLLNCGRNFPLVSLTSSFVSMPLLSRDAQLVFSFVASMFLTQSLMYPMIASCTLTPCTTSAVEAVSVWKFWPKLFNVLSPNGVFIFFFFFLFFQSIPSGLHLVGILLLLLLLFLFSIVFAWQGLMRKVLLWLTHSLAPPLRSIPVQSNDSQDEER